MDNPEACAELLQYPLIGNGYHTAYFLQPDGQVKKLDGRDASSHRCFRQIKANGVGNLCRWMLTDEALIVRYRDGTYVSKPCPAEHFYGPGIAYRNIFSFCVADADIIVLSAPHRTFVVRVTGQSIEEETLPIDVRCLHGSGVNSLDFMLVGQSPRTGAYDPGLPMMLWVNGGNFSAKVLAPVNRIKLEAIVALLPAAGKQLLVCAEAQPPPGMESYDIEYTCDPGSLDHDDFQLITQDDSANLTPLRLRNVRFIGCAGPHGHERVFFRVIKTNGPIMEGTALATMMSIGGFGDAVTHDVVGLDDNCYIERIQYDPLVGWFGLARLSGTDDQFLLASPDCRAWRALPIL